MTTASTLLRRARRRGAPLAAATLMAAAPALAGEMVLPSEVAVDHWKTGYMERFAEAVETATDGALTVAVFPAGQLYSDQDALAALGTGAVHMVWPVSVRLETIASGTGVLSLPFALSDEMMVNACVRDGVTQMLSKELDGTGVAVIGLLRTADPLFIFADEEIASMADLAGKKVRITGGRVLLDTMERIGVSPVSMAASEMATALAQGAIDGVFTSPDAWAKMIGPSGRYAFHVPGFSLLTYAVAVDEAWFAALPEKQRNAVTEAIESMVAEQWVAARAVDEETLARLAAEGATIHQADEAETERWRTLVAATSEAFAAAHPEAAAAMDEILARCGG